MQDWDELFGERPKYIRALMLVRFLKDWDGYQLPTGAKALLHPKAAANI
jgi:hypothetical protein